MFMCKESKRYWIDRTIDVESIDFVRDPKNLVEILSVDASITSFFNFQRALNIDGRNNKTKCLDSKAHSFWKFLLLKKRETN